MTIHKTISILVTLLLIISTQSCNKVSEISFNPMSELAEIKKINNKLQKSGYTNIENIPSSLSDWRSLSELAKLIKDLLDGEYQIFENTEGKLETLFSKVEVDVPGSLNTPSILARFKVLETIAYKLKMNFTDQNNSIKFETDKQFLIVAYSNLIFQITKTLEKESQIKFKNN